MCVTHDKNLLPDLPQHVKDSENIFQLVTLGFKIFSANAKDFSTWSGMAQVLTALEN